MDAEFRKQEAGDQRAGDTDENIADDAEAGATHDFSSQPPRHQADEQNNQNAFVGHSHETSPPSLRPSDARRAYPESREVTTEIQASAEPSSLRPPERKTSVRGEDLGSLREDAPRRPL